MHTLTVPRRPVRPAPLGPSRARGCLSQLPICEENARFVLLFILLATYLLFGAVVFEFAESGESERFRQRYDTILANFKSKYVLQRNRTVSETDLMLLLNAHKNATAIGLLYNRQRWDFSGSLYFTGTLISTIGFGMSVPQTAFGRTFVIIYGFFGCASTILLFNIFLERVITGISFFLRRIHRRCSQSRKPRQTSTGTMPSIEISDASDVSLPEPTLKHQKTIVTWKPSVFGVQVALLGISGCWILLAATTFCLIEDWNFFEAIYYCFVAFSTVGFGDYVASQFNETSHRSLGAWVHLYRVANFCYLTVGCCLIYSLFNVTSILIRQYLDRMMRKLDIPCSKTLKNSLCFGRKQAKPYLGLGLTKPLRKGRRDHRYSEDQEEGEEDSRRSSTTSKVSLLEFLAQNQASVFTMHKQLVITKSFAESNTRQRPSSSSCTAITETPVGPLQIMSQKFGSDD